jgi:replicative DNA helicase
VIRHGVVLVVVDHVGKILPLSERYGSRHLELATIVSGLKDTARALSIPILLLVQLNRDVERRQVARPVLADLRESGALEEEAGVVIFLWTKQAPEEWGPEVAVEMTAAKVRWGETGERVMTFQRRYGRFQ